MPDPSERLDLNDYPAPDGWCPEKERDCVWAIHSECTIVDGYECPG